MKSQSRELVALVVLGGLALSLGCGGGDGGNGPIAQPTAYAASPIAPGLFTSSLNDAGTAAVYSGDAGNHTPQIWVRGSGLTSLTLPSGVVSGDTQAVNNKGVVVGHGTTGAGKTRAIVWVSGVAQDIGDLGGGSANAFAINDKGQVVGTSTDGTGAEHPFIWTSAGGMTDLSSALGHRGLRPTAINNAGLIVGGSALGPADAFAYSTSKGYTGLGNLGQWSFADGVNDQGEAVGLSVDAGGGFHSFVWNSTTGMKDIEANPASGGSLGNAYGINSSGLVVGRDQQNEAYVWSAAKGMQVLTPMTTGLPGGVTLLRSSAINSQGLIVASGSDGILYLLTPAS